MVIIRKRSLKSVQSLHPSTSAAKRHEKYAKFPFGESLSRFAADHLNFYRVHLSLFIIVPLITSGIFYALDTNEFNHIAYIDSLYMCVSASTVTGLVTIESSTMSTLQQVLLFILMSCGSTSFVSIVTVVIRRKFFKRKFDYLIASNADLRRKVQEIAVQEATLHPLRSKLNNMAHPNIPHHISSSTQPTTNDSTAIPSSSSNSNSNSTSKDKNKKRNKKPDRITSDMVRRLDTPVRVNQMNVGGWLRDEDVDGNSRNEESENLSSKKIEVESIPDGERIKDFIKAEDPPQHTRDHIIFEEPNPSSNFTKEDLRFRRNHTHDPTNNRRTSSSHQHSLTNTKTLRRTGTYPPHAHRDLQKNSLYSDFGGINPFSIAIDFVKKLPVIKNFERSLTLPRSTTLQSVHTVRDTTATAAGGGKGVERSNTISYLTFDATVGRNSAFRGLTRAQEEELGGVEFRALTLLLKIVIGYWFFFQMISVLILAPYLTYSKTHASLFNSPPARVNLNPTFFTFFQVWSAWSNNGMSLIDTSMVPFFESYLFIVVLSILILAGNTAFPCFLRLVIWIVSKLVPSRSRTKETLEFLLAHPRRCFIYLFPSHQTWFLVFVLCVLNGIDWVSFLVLDVGNPEITALPIGTRMIDGLLQSFAVRSAGFNVVNLSKLAPAVQFLYCIMMYVAVYPIAISVRSTNVYEDKSMGVFSSPGEDDDDAEDRFRESNSTSGYLAYHARKQLSFDMWWLVTAVWLICIIERDAIQSDKRPWITIFSIAFELSSAYGTVGLSLGGAPNLNASLSADLKTGSKIILIAVMIRGRHRGLPLAIDRAVLLPSDLERHDDEVSEEFAPGCESPEELSNVLNHVEEEEEEGNDENGKDVDVESKGNPKENYVNKNQEGWTEGNS